MARRVAPRLIRDVMSARPKTVGPKMSVRDLQGFFASYNFNAFPVVAGGKYLGMIAPSDALRALAEAD